MIDDDDIPEIIRGLNYQTLKAIEDCDLEEISIERTIDELLKNRKRIGNAYFKDNMEKISRKYYQMGNDLVDENEYMRALDMYTKSIKISKRYLGRLAVDSYFNRAITFVILGYPKLGLMDLIRIEKKPPIKPDIFYLKGEIYEFMGKYKMAQKMYMKSYLIDPNYEKAKNKLNKNILIL